MRPSQEFWHGFVYGVMAIIMILLLMETSRQGQRANKKGPEENDDKSSWRSEFEVKRVNCVEKSPIIKISGTQNIIHKICVEKMCA